MSARSVSLCDDSSVDLQCDNANTLTLTVSWSVSLSDLPTSDLPNLHDISKQRTPTLASFANRDLLNTFVMVGLNELSSSDKKLLLVEHQVITMVRFSSWLQCGPG